MRSSRISSRHRSTRHDRFRPRRCATRHRGVPSIPCDAEGPVFREPWEAQAFALTLSLYDRGLFIWPEWAAILGDEIKKAQAAGDPDTGETYYRHWLAALERIVAEKGVTDAARCAILRRVGSRRRPHPARQGNRVAAGGFLVNQRSGVWMCSGRTPRPTRRAGMRRRNGSHRISRIDERRLRPLAAGARATEACSARSPACAG